MKCIAAYLLAVAGGDENPSEEKIKSILESVGIQTDLQKIQELIQKMRNRNLEDLISEGSTKLSMASGSTLAPPPSN